MSLENLGLKISLTMNPSYLPLCSDKKGQVYSLGNFLIDRYNSAFMELVIGGSILGAIEDPKDKR